MNSDMIISLTVAMDRAGGIGKDGRTPWHLRTDLRRTKVLTMGHYLIVGRHTWESIGRVLPGRKMIVVSRNPDYLAEGVAVAHTLADALLMAEDAGETEVFLGGGSHIFDAALPLAHKIYLTEVDAICNCDTFMPYIDPNKWHEIERTSYPAGEHDDYPFTERVLITTSSD